MTYQRFDNRTKDALRPITIRTGFLETAEGSCWIEFGKTKVICTASFQETTPSWIANGRGWLTAEYGMLPKSSKTRIPREGSTPKGRTSEIQRLIGRSLRSIMDFEAIDQRMITIDCDVIQADGGTRTAAITGAMIALWEACVLMVEAGAIRKWPIRERIAAVSVGLVEKTPLLDLCYVEDSMAEVDMNVVMTESGNFVEIQGTAESRPFSRDELDQMLGIAQSGIFELLKKQEEILSPVPSGSVSRK
jgi:ribonuclease PH